MVTLAGALASHSAEMDSEHRRAERAARAEPCSEGRSYRTRVLVRAACDCAAGDRSVTLAAAIARYRDVSPLSRSRHTRSFLHGFERATGERDDRARCACTIRSQWPHREHDRARARMPFAFTCASSSTRDRLVKGLARERCVRIARGMRSTAHARYGVDSRGVSTFTPGLRRGRLGADLRSPPRANPRWTPGARWHAVNVSLDL